MGITIEKVEAIATKLRAMPPIETKKRVVSKQESIKMLTSEIAEMRERGYSLEQIAALLTEDDLQIGAPTLKSYLQRAATSKQERKKPSTKRKATSVSAAQNSMSQTKSDSGKTEGQQIAPSIGERAATALSKVPSNASNATAAITRPDRRQL